MSSLDLTSGTLSDSLAAGMALPATWYSDPAILSHERERIFAGAWQYLGRSEAVTSRAPFSPVASATFRSSPSAARTASCVASRTSADTARTSSPKARAAVRRSSARTTPGRTTSTGRCSVPRAPSASPASTPSCTPSSPSPSRRGGRSSLQTPIPRRGHSPSTSRGSLNRSRRAASASRPSAGASASPGSSRRTGRTGSRITSSATTVPSHIPGSRKVVNVDPDTYTLIPRTFGSSQKSVVREGVREGKVKAPYVPSDEVSDPQYHLAVSRTPRSTSSPASRTSGSMPGTPSHRE